MNILVYKFLLIYLIEIFFKSILYFHMELNVAVEFELQIIGIRDHLIFFNHDVD